MDWTPFLHAAIAVACQVVVGMAFGNWWLGAALACAWWVAREHTQAEYRWIAQFGKGLRAGMPWWGGFDPRAWTLASMLDLGVPVAACAALWLYLAWGEAIF